VAVISRSGVEFHIQLGRFSAEWPVIPYEDFLQNGLSFHILVRAETIREPTIRLQLSREMAIYGTLWKMPAGQHFPLNLTQK